MPAVHTYVVTQERKTSVRAENPHKAAEIAEHVFAGSLPEAQRAGLTGPTTPDVVITGLTVEREF